MAKTIAKNHFVSIGGTDLSDSVKSVVLNYEAESKDLTAMGADTREMAAGLKNWTLDVEFFQDYAAGELDSVLFGLLGTNVTVIVRPDAGAVSTSNPQFNCPAVLLNYNPINGSVGDEIMTSVTLNSAGTLTRTTS